MSRVGRPQRCRHLLLLWRVAPPSILQPQLVRFCPHEEAASLLKDWGLEPLKCLCRLGYNCTTVRWRYRLTFAESNRL